jgi:hypothetical protein
MAVQMGHNRRSRAGSYGAFEVTRIHLHRFRVDINVERLRATRANRSRPIPSCVCYRNHSIFRNYADAAQSELECVGSIRYSHSMPHTAISGKRRLECHNLVAKYKAPTANNGEYRRFECRSLPGELPCEVEYGNRPHANSGPSVSTIAIVDAHDVVLAEVVSALHLDHQQWRGAGIFEAVRRG